MTSGAATGGAVAHGAVAHGDQLASGDQLAHGDLAPFTPTALITEADPLSFMAAGLAVAAALYLWGVVRLRRRGHRWSGGRLAMFLAGLGALASVTVTGLAAYDTTLVSVHMVQHMVLTMIAPIFLALGAPVTLALRTLSPRPRRALLAVLHSRYARFITFPLVSFTLFIANPFVLYFSGLYRASLESPWLHEFIHLHFIAVGSVFFWPLIGLDPVPGRVSYPLRALLMFLSTPFHTVLGLTVMQSVALLGGDWYPSLQLSWVDPAEDQRLAGGILWAGGEFVAVVMLGALVYQWMRHAEREARRIDRALDRAEAEAEAAAAGSAASAGAAGSAASAGAAGSAASASPATADSAIKESRS